MNARLLGMLEPAQIYPPGAGHPSVQLLDVRAPKEVAKGALPNSVFEPILTNEERHLVGICYKEQGQDAAIKLGYELTDKVMPERVERWRTASQSAPTAVMCWRGGLRSRLAHEFTDIEGLERVAGGYKALRNYLMQQLEPTLNRKSPLIVTGLTGSGKTDFLTDVAADIKDVQVLDLEGEANHRGSAFGVRGEQPSQQSFENALAAQLVLSPAETVLLEDESHRIGSLFLPKPIWKEVRLSKVLWLESTLEERVSRIFEDYVQTETRDFGFEATYTKLTTNVAKVRQRLGSAKVDDCLDTLDAARKAWLEPAAHQAWIETFLLDYYDPLYTKSVTDLNREIAFRGDAEACKAWLRGNEEIKDPKPKI